MILLKNKKKMNKLYKPEKWAANKLIHQNNTRLNDMLFQWSDFSNNIYKFPFNTVNTSKSNIMTELFPYLSKLSDDKIPNVRQACSIAIKKLVRLSKK